MTEAKQAKAQTLQEKIIEYKNTQRRGRPKKIRTQEEIEAKKKKQREATRKSRAEAKALVSGMGRK